MRHLDPDFDPILGQKSATTSRADLEFKLKFLNMKCSDEPDVWHGWIRSHDTTKPTRVVTIRIGEDENGVVCWTTTIELES
jgi:hypothetical protein